LTFASVHGLRLAAAAWNRGSPGVDTAYFSYSLFRLVLTDRRSRM